MTARRAPAALATHTTGRGGPRRPSRAVSTATPALSPGTSASTVAGGSESHAMPASPALSGDGPGGSTYHSPARSPRASTSTAPRGRNRRHAAGAPAATTRSARATAAATTPVHGGERRAVAPAP